MPGLYLGDPVAAVIYSRMSPAGRSRGPITDPCHSRRMCSQLSNEVEKGLSPSAKNSCSIIPGWSHTMEHSSAAQMAATWPECATHFLPCALPLSGALDRLSSKQPVAGSSSKPKIQNSLDDDIGLHKNENNNSLLDMEQNVIGAEGRAGDVL